MVRTKATSSGVKAVAAKAPRKALGGGGGGGAGPSGFGSPKGGKPGKYDGGNAYCPRPTPEWQKGIDNFFTKLPKKDKENEKPEDPDEPDAKKLKSDDEDTIKPTSSSKLSEDNTNEDTDNVEKDNEEKDNDSASEDEKENNKDSDDEAESPVKTRKPLIESDEDE